MNKGVNQVLIWENHARLNLIDTWKIKENIDTEVVLKIRDALSSYITALYTSHELIIEEDTNIYYYNYHFIKQ